MDGFYELPIGGVLDVHTHVHEKEHTRSRLTFLDVTWQVRISPLEFLKKMNTS